MCMCANNMYDRSLFVEKNEHEHRNKYNTTTTLFHTHICAHTHIHTRAHTQNTRINTHKIESTQTRRTAMVTKQKHSKSVSSGINRTNVALSRSYTRAQRGGQAWKDAHKWHTLLSSDIHCKVTHINSKHVLSGTSYLQA